MMDGVFTSEVLTQMAWRPRHCPHNRPGQHGTRNSAAPPSSPNGILAGATGYTIIPSPRSLYCRDRSTRIGSQSPAFHFWQS